MKEREINEMSKLTILQELKNIGLPSFGTAAERKERLKKHFGIPESEAKNIKRGNVVEEIKKLEENREKRRRLMQQKKEEIEEAKIRNEKAGRNVDFEYDKMIHENWLTNEIASEHVQSDHMKI